MGIWPTLAFHLNWGLFMDERTIRESLRSFVVREVIRRPGLQLANNQGVFTQLGGHSLELAQLGQFIASEFRVSIPQRELTVANFDTLDQMVARVMRG